MKAINRFWYLFIVSQIMVLAVASCSSSNNVAQHAERPVWIDDPARLFSEAQYLMAVGSSDTREGAVNQAHANLAKIFVAEVKVDESYINEFEEAMDSHSEVSVSENTQLITSSQIRANQQLKNVQIMEVYEDSDGRIYALAGMDRLETTRLYSSDIERNNTRIKSLRQNAKNSAGRLDRLIYLKQALAVARINDMMRNQRAILSGRGHQGDGATLTEIIQEYQQAKKECRVVMSGEELLPEVASVISRELQNEGFILVNDNEEPVIELDVDFAMKPVDLNRSQYEFIQWALQLKAQDMENGQWFSTFTAEGREGSTNEEYARQRAIQAAVEKISSELPKYINNELLSTK